MLYYKHYTDDQLKRMFASLDNNLYHLLLLYVDYLTLIVKDSR
jgi:hypothetical protein